MKKWLNLRTWKSRAFDGKKKKKKKKKERFERGLNSRPSACEADVITTTPSNLRYKSFSSANWAWPWLLVIEQNSQSAFFIILPKKHWNKCRHFSNFLSFRPIRRLISPSLFIHFRKDTHSLQPSNVTMSSKPGAVGNNMPEALKGNVPGAVSKNYKGKPSNAIPNHPHNPDNSQSVAKWTQDHMQSKRKDAAKKWLSKTVLWMSVK